MAPLEWDKVMAAKPTSLGEEDIDNFYEALVSYEPDVDDVGKLKQLFLVARGVMKGKNEQVEEAMDEMEKETKASKKKEQELMDEMDRLEKKAKDLEKYGGDSGKGTARVMREELQELEKQNEDLKQEVKDLQRDLGNESRTAEKYSERISELEKLMKDLRDDNDQMRQDITEYKLQLQAKQTAMAARDDEGYRDKLMRKNKELAENLEELQNLTDANEMLQQRCEDLQKNLEDAIQQMDRTTEDYTKLKAVLQQSDSVTDKLREENEILNAKVNDLNEQVQSKTDADDAIMVAVDNKIEEWKLLLEDKDKTIMELQEQLYGLREQLIAANMDADKASVAALSKIIKEKDKQIEELTEQLRTQIDDMEQNTALIQDMQGELQRTGKGPGDRQQQKIREMTKELKYQKERNTEFEKDVKAAEKDASEKDKELTEALERMRQYEAGEYGLAEAVAEIKEGKNQVKVRDRQIEELTQYINKAEMKMNDVLEENEDLRGRLGMDPREPIDLTEFRSKKNVRREEEKALNLILQREVERLEEERLDLKQKIRKLAQHTGQRAVALGLTAEDMILVQDYTENLKTKRKPESTADIIKKEVAQQETHMRAQVIDQDFRENLREMDHLYSDNAQMKAKLEQLEEENRNYEAGLKEVMEAMKKYGTDEKGEGESYERPVMQFPTLERMLAAIEAKSVLGRHDTSLFIKAQCDNLQGRNDELRSVLREARLEGNKAQLELEKAYEKIKHLEEESQALKDTGAGTGFFKAMPLPESMAVTSAEVIASLNEHLVVTLQENHIKEENMKKMESSLENYRRKFAVVRHQQGLLYADYIKDKKEWESDMKKLQDDLRNIEGAREEDKVRLQEFDRLVDTLGKDDVEVRRRLSEMTRRLTVLRVNEKALTRRYQTMEEVEGHLRKEGNRLKNEMTAMQTAVAERMGYLQRYKDTSAFKIAALQRVLDESVPTADLEHANKKYQELTEKYRDLLEKGNSLVTRAEAITGLEGEVKRLTIDNEELKRTLGLEKEKLHTLEAALEELHRKGVTDGTEIKGITDADAISVSKKITTLEMKELNERQRAEHAVRMHEQQRHILHEVENRNKDLEEKFGDAMKSNLELQKIERDLRDELANSVTKAVSDADRKKIAELEASELALKQEISKLKEITEIADSQVKALETQKISQEKEGKSLRQQLLDFQVQSDEKTIIGKLHRHIVQLQVSEGTAIRKWEEQRKKNTKLEAQVLRLEQRLDDKDATIYHNKTEAQNKIKHLKRNLQDLRLQFAGAIPLSKQERFSKSMSQLQIDKAKLEQDLMKVNKTKDEVEDKLAALQLQHGSLQDLIATLKDGRGAAKVIEWHGKMDAIRLEELKQKRANGKLHQQIKYLEGIIRTHEAAISELEADNVRLTKDYEERQLRWEHREVELERTIASLERQAEEIAGAASKFEEAVGSLPDSKLPVANQLEQAISTIRANVKIILDTQAENKRLKERNKEVEKLIRETEQLVIARDKLISELRLRMPASSDRDDIIAKAQAKVTSAMQEKQTPRNYESEQSMRIAQSTISSLQARVQQKEETIAKYQELLRQARDDMQEMNRRHEQELKAMQQKIHMTTDATFSKFKEATQQLLSKQIGQPITNKQIARLNELEDQVVEQENALAAMSQKIQQRDVEISSLRAKLQYQDREFTGEKQKLVDHLRSEIEHKNSEIARLKQSEEHHKKELDLLNEEVATVKDANNRAPTTTMKNLVERLKNQLALKEKQHAALSKALTELRADMVTQAQDQVKSHAEDSAQNINVQKLIDKHTKEMADQIEDLQTTTERQKKEIKKRKEHESTLMSDVDDLREEMARKDKTLHKLKGDKQRLEQEVEELERKVERMSTMRVQKTGEENKLKEMEELRRQVRLLEDELKRKRQAAEKPYEQKQASPREPPGKGSGGSEDLLKWEESKKWQRTVEKMRTKIKERDMEIDKLQKSNKMMKDMLDRATREKESLERKISALQRGGGGVPGPSGPPGKPDHILESLKDRNFKLQEENADLKRQLMLGKDAAFHEVQLRNQHLMEQVDTMEKVVAKKVSAAQKSPEDLSGPGLKQYQEIFDKNQQLQKQVLQMSEENMELKFEAEQARKDVPRLKDRISDLQKYVEALKAENAHLQPGSGTSRSQESISISSSIKRIGESGKSTRELEKTIALLKKVVERVQMENEHLKRAPGVVSNEQLQNLKRENEGLKGQLEELRQKMGATLSERYLTTQKGTAKMMEDYEKMRKDLMKEMETNEKLRVQLAGMEIKVEQRGKELEESKTRLQIEEGKQPNMQAMDSKGWKSVVVTRMYEEKMKGMEADLEKKNKMLADTKILLKESAEREQQLMAENRELQQKIDVLERFPTTSSAVTDSDLMRDFQQARLKIDRLENEKKEVVHELQILRQRGGAGGVDIGDDIIMKASQYDKAMTDNIELQLEVKSVKLEKDKMKFEVDRLRKELTNFGPDFFEEIEDLKFNYRQAMEKNVLYEEKLHQISEQFGISLGIPGV